MKKFIGLIVVVIIIWIVVQTIDWDFSQLLSSGKQIYSGKTTTVFSQVPEESWTYEDILGVPFPDSATEVKGYTEFRWQRYTGERSSSVIATLPKEDFYDLVEQVDLIKKPDLIESWPDAFNCRPGALVGEE